jgi:hypothetical protein
MTSERLWEVKDIDHTYIVPTGLTKVVIKIIDLLILPTFDKNDMIDTKDRYLWECIRQDCKNNKCLTMKRFYTLLSYTTKCLLFNINLSTHHLVELILLLSVKASFVVTIRQFGSLITSLTFVSTQCIITFVYLRKL